VSFLPIFERVGGAKGFENASDVELLEAGLPLYVLEACRAEHPERPMGPELQHLLLGEPAYPKALLDLHKPPPVLWARGRCALLHTPGLAVVGSRACTPYGKQIAMQLGRMESASQGVLISGAARGIDSAAHRGALESGRTIAILGAGLDAKASFARKKLLNEISAGGGLLLSEFPPSHPPTRWTFPLRNRIIAALSRATVVVEAAARSGARITAGQARDLGREVYAVPGRIDAPASMGCNLLLSEGARVLLRPSEAIWDRSSTARGDLPDLIRHLLGGPLSLGELAIRTGMHAVHLNQEIGQFELDGLLQRIPGGRIALS
jgi:DNA processing protein